MSTPTEEMTVDFDAIDAEVARGKANGAEKTAAEDKTDPVVVETTETAAPAAAKQALTPEAGVEKLKKQLDEERALRVAAEQRERESANAEAEARGTVQTSHLEQIKSAIAQVTQSSDQLESKYAESAAAGDWVAAAKAQREMAANAAKLQQLEAGKTALEKAPKPQPRAPTDPVEAFCAQLSGPSAKWVRENREYVTDQHKHQQMLAAHQLAIARGIKADSPEYFSSIEKTLEIGAGAVVVPAGDDADDDPMAAAAATPVVPARRAPAAAPVSRSGNGTGSRANVVKLSPAQVEAARDSGMTVEEYAKQGVALRKEGKLQ
jgi:hypothetical protein